ncbi:MAG TPA: hypothetical protein VGF40_09465 [Thermoanaerobaculia bacterium]
MTETLRAFGRLRCVRRGAEIVLAVGVVALLVVPGIGLIAALLGLVVLLAVHLAKPAHKVSP